VWWAVFYELALAEQRRPRRLATASAISALAYLVDYFVVSKRLRPGFEAHLSARGMFAVYAALAAGFAFSGGHGSTPVRERQHQRKRTALPRDAREPQLAAEEPRQLAADR
jgi:hypothetical protein